MSKKVCPKLDQDLQIHGISSRISYNPNKKTQGKVLILIPKKKKKTHLYILQFLWNLRMKFRKEMVILKPLHLNVTSIWKQIDIQYLFVEGKR